MYNSTKQGSQIISLRNTLVWIKYRHIQTPFSLLKCYFPWVGREYCFEFLVPSPWCPTSNPYPCVINNAHFFFSLPPLWRIRLSFDYIHYSSKRSICQTVLATIFTQPVEEVKTSEFADFLKSLPNSSLQEIETMYNIYSNKLDCTLMTMHTVHSRWINKP